MISVDSAYLWLSFFSQDTIWKSSWAAKVPKSNNLPAESNFLACLCKITSMKNSSAEGSFSSFWLEVEAMRALKKNSNQKKFRQIEFKFLWKIFLREIEEYLIWFQEIWNFYIPVIIRSFGFAIGSRQVFMIYCIFGTNFCCPMGHGGWPASWNLQGSQK